VTNLYRSASCLGVLALAIGFLSASTKAADFTVNVIDLEGKARTGVVIKVVAVGHAKDPNNATQEIDVPIPDADGPNSSKIKASRNINDGVYQFNFPKEAESVSLTFSSSDQNLVKTTRLEGVRNDKARVIDIVVPNANKADDFFLLPGTCDPCCPTHSKRRGWFFGRH